MLEIVTAILLVGGGLFALLLILLAMLHRACRSFLMPIIGWGFALFCRGVHIVARRDHAGSVAGLLGIIDDAGVLAAGLLAASSAIRAGKANRQRSLS